MLTAVFTRRHFALPAAVAVAVAASALAGASTPSASVEKSDALAREIARLRTFLGATSDGDEIAADVKQSMGPMLEQAEQARATGYPLLALLRLARAREGVAALEYMNGLGAPDARTGPLFEKEWARLGAQLEAPADAHAFDGVTPAAVRAIGEAVLPQVRVYYEASLEYGRNTQADAGLYYLGAAQAQRDFAAFCKTLASPAARPAPALRALGPELDALERDLLAAYKPPAAIDRHREFIAASAALKEARELDAAGLRFGAFLRYLSALQRFEPLRPQAAAPGREEMVRVLDAFAKRLEASGSDPSIGRVFVEYARADLAQATEQAPPALAAAIVGGIVPRYFPALEPAPVAAPAPAPRVTVTLVRWPYT